MTQALAIAKNQIEKSHPAAFVPWSLILLDIEAKDRSELFEKMIAPTFEARITSDFFVQERNQKFIMSSRKSA